jgi:His-Xaa-Ser system protein HxsD
MSLLFEKMGGVSKIDDGEGFVLVSVDPKIYPLEVIYTAAYVFLERAYVFLEGDLEKEVVIKLTTKVKSSKEELDILGKEFLNELINYGLYKTQSEKNGEIRQILLQRALLTNLDEEEDFEEDSEDEDDLDSLEDLESSEELIDDPEGIAIPWEEKYGKDENKTADCLESSEELIDDPEGIAIPWEEKYGKEGKKNGNSK